MENNIQETSKNVIQREEDNVYVSHSASEYNSSNLIAVDYIAGTNNNTSEHKRKISIEDQASHKKQKANIEMNLTGISSNEQLEQISEREGNTCEQITKENLPEVKLNVRPVEEQVKIQNANPQKISCQGYFATFSNELPAENVICLSGCRLNIHNNNGTSSINYAEKEFGKNIFNHSENSNSFTNSLHCNIDHSQYESKILIEKLKNETSFYEALCEITELLKQKNSKKKTVDLFSAMSHIHCHVLYLVVKKEDFELDSTKAKSDLVDLIKETCKLLVDIENVFKLSLDENNKSNFTKKQKKNIELWAKHCREFITCFMEEIVSYECSLSEQSNDSKDNAELYKENEILNCDQEDFVYFTPFPEIFTDYAVSFICERLSREETFNEAADIVISWLEKDECSDKNVISFVSIVHCIHNYLEKLQDKKIEYEEVYIDARRTLMKHFNEILSNLIKIERIYLTLSLEPCSNYFTPPERKHIELGIRCARKLNSDLKKKMHEIRKEERMDRSRKHAQLSKELNDGIQKLKEDHRSLKCYFKEVESNIANFRCTYKKDFKRLDEQLQSLNRDVRKFQKMILKLKERSFTNEIEIQELRNSIYRQNIEHELPSDSAYPTQSEFRVISLVCIYLRVNPGASMDSIRSYLRNIDISIDCGIVENLMRKFPAMFQECMVHIGDELQKKWYYTIF